MASDPPDSSAPDRHDHWRSSFGARPYIPLATSFHDQQHDQKCPGKQAYAPDERAIIPEGPVGLEPLGNTHATAVLFIHTHKGHQYGMHNMYTYTYGVENEYCSFARGAA